MVRIELCRLPFSFQSSNVKISAVVGAVRLGAIYFLIGMFASMRLANTLHTHRVLRSLYKARKMPFFILCKSKLKTLISEKKLECIKCLLSFFGIHASHAQIKDGCA